jgi:hypothetical protein
VVVALATGSLPVATVGGPVALTLVAAVLGVFVEVGLVVVVATVAGAAAGTWRDGGGQSVPGGVGVPSED